MASTPTPPRQGSETVAGVSWLARMIDKARLDAAGQIEPFDLVYPCPMDQRLLGQLQIEASVFQNIVVNNPSDEAIVDALRAAGAKELPAAEASSANGGAACSL